MADSTNVVVAITMVVDETPTSPKNINAILVVQGIASLIAFLPVAQDTFQPCPAYLKASR